MKKSIRIAALLSAMTLTLWPTNSSSGIPNGWTVNDAN